MHSFIKKHFYLFLLFTMIFLLHHCAYYTPVDPGDNSPSNLAFYLPLPENDTVMIDEFYTGSIGGAGDNKEYPVTLFFTGVPEGYTYNPSDNHFIWKADKNIFNANAGPFTITAGLTDTRDTIYHTWTVYVKKHVWEFMSCDDEFLAFAAYDSDLVFKLTERKDSVHEGVGYLTGSVTRSHDGGMTWENSPICAKVLKRFFKDDLYSFQGLRNIKVFNNFVYFTFHVATGNTGPVSFQAWNLLSVDIDANPFSTHKKYSGSYANHRYDYHVSPIGKKVYQLSSSVSPTMTFASASIFCDTVEEIRLQQSIGKTIGGTNKNDVVWTSFYYFGVYRKLGENGTWENVYPAMYQKIEVAGDMGDTLYLLDSDSTLYSAIHANAVSLLIPEKITTIDKIADIKMCTGKTGWVLTRQGEVYFTNNMFGTVTKESIYKDGVEVEIASFVKAFNDRHLFAISKNGEIFRY